MKKQKAVIIGAGPAGLTAAYELLERTNITPIIFEATGDIGGIAKTVTYKGNRMDMGGHRFFSKSDVVMNWWLNVFPVQGKPSRDDLQLGIDKPYSTEKNAPDPEKADRVMLIRNRLSRIFFLRKFFDYPVKLNLNTVLNLGFVRIMRVGFSYLYAMAFPIKPEKSLEDFIINRFGRELYNTFFKDYTEKVWGVPPANIKPDWGSQRIKGISIVTVLLHAVKVIFKRHDASIEQKGTETSLIEQFIYPKFGPGQLWEQAARRITDKGGEIHLHHEVMGVETKKDRIVSVTVRDARTGKSKRITGDYFFSTMPIKDLVAAMGKSAPPDIKKLSDGLVYRDFITVGLLLNKMKIHNETTFKTVNDIVPDNWIYIQESDVRVGRLQIFNNWSPYMVKDPNKVWIGMEYFCNEGDDLWSKSESEFGRFAIDELASIDIVEKEDVIDFTVIKLPKTYPAYFGTYDRFDEIRRFTDRFTNLFLVGRNGMHRYNNMDHSMLTAMTAVDNIVNGVSTKDNIWEVNTEEEYHEEKK